MKTKFYLKSMVVAATCAMFPVSSLWAESPFAGGEGIPGSPYLIETPEQFNEIRNYLTSMFQLEADLDFADFGDWVPVGLFHGTRFSGILDGNGHVIKNLRIISSGDASTGLFGTTQDAAISKLILQDCYAEGAERVGILAGCLLRTTVDQVAVINAEVVNTVGFYTGLLVGNVHDDATVTDCYTSGIATGNAAGVGGITGYMEHRSNLVNCYSTASVIGKERATAGICGGVPQDSYIINCVAINDKIVVNDWVPVNKEGYANDIARVVSEIQQDNVDVPQNNYAWDGIDVEVSITNEPASKNGEDATMEELKSVTFYAENLGWDINPTGEDEYYVQIWKIDPEISEYPVFVWQSSSSSVKQVALDNYSVAGSDEGIRISGLTGGENITIYTVSGAKAGSFVSKGSEAFFPVTANGVYLVSVNGTVKKVAK